MNDVDVLVIGGGLQGLVILDDLTAAGYSTLLVTDGELGAGQTLHSHGLLNSGAGLVTGEPQAELTRHVLPRLRRLGVPVYGADASYLGFPPPAVEQLAPLWERRDYHPLPVPAQDLPAGLTSPLRFFRVPGYHVPKRTLVDRLSRQDHIVRGRVTPDGQGFRIHALHGPSFSVRPQATVVAAGCGTKRFLTDVLGLTGGTVSGITYSTNHMLCLRSPAGVLPAIGTIMTPAVMIAGHVDRAHATVGDSVGDRETVSWYVTPPPGDSDRRAEAPADATAETNPATVSAAVAAVRDLFSGIDWNDPRIEATAFAGTKQDIDDQPTTRLLDLCAPDRRVFAALPSVMANTFANARDLLRQLPDLGVRPGAGSYTPPPTPPVPVGTMPERRPEVPWHPFATFESQARARAGR